jgi:uncharacterized protein DUF732
MFSRHARRGLGRAAVAGDRGVCPATWSAFVAVTLAVAALVFAAPASADGNDDAFIAALENNGVNLNDHNAAVTMGHNVCSALDKGHDESFLVLDIIHDTHLSARQAGYFLGVSVAAYCPQYKGTLDPSLTWLVPGLAPPPP